MTVTSLADTLGRAICAETCAYKGEPPCYTIDKAWPPKTCDEPGCQALGQAAAAVAYPVRVREPEMTLVETRIHHCGNMHAMNYLVDTKHLPNIGDRPEALSVAVGEALSRMKDEMVFYTKSGKLK